MQKKLEPHISHTYSAIDKKNVYKDMLPTYAEINTRVRRQPQEEREDKTQTLTHTRSHYIKLCTNTTKLKEISLLWSSHH